MSQPRTIVEKIWNNHIVAEQPGAPGLIYIDLHLCHEVTTPQAFQTLRDRGAIVAFEQEYLAERPWLSC